MGVWGGVGGVGVWGVGGSKELKCQELMEVGVAFQLPITHTQHNQQQHCDFETETSSNTYRSLLSDIKYL